MPSLPNILSLTRIPLAFIFLQESPFLRAFAICLALITDGLDGYLARRNNATSNLGKILDPLTDKFFVFFCLAVLFQEQRIQFWQILAMLGRDCSIVLYGLYLIISGNLSKSRLNAIWCGKITTFLQLCVMMSLTLHYTVPNTFYSLFVVLGVLALFELYYKEKALSSAG